MVHQKTASRVWPQEARTRSDRRPIALACCLVILFAFISTTSAQESARETRKVSAGPASARSMFGTSIAMTQDSVLVGAPGLSGSAYVYRRDATGTILMNQLAIFPYLAGDGTAVALRDDMAIVGSPTRSRGAAFVFQFDGTRWNQIQHLTAPGQSISAFGFSMDMPDEILVIGGPYEEEGRQPAGAVFLYRFDGLRWILTQRLVASSRGYRNEFGYDVAIDGTWLVASALFDDSGARDAGAVYVFSHDGNEWVEHQQLIAPDAERLDRFGHSIAIEGDLAVVGTPGDDDAAVDAGAAYVYRRTDDNWVLDQKIVAVEATPSAAFGSSTAIRDGAIVIGAPGTETGAAYMFRKEPNGWNLDYELSRSDADGADSFGGAIVAGDRWILVGSPTDSDEGWQAGSFYAFDAPLPSGSCRLGTVDLGRGPNAADVLLVNDQAGRGKAREFDIAIGEPITISMESPPAGPLPAPYVLYAWPGAPDRAASHPQPRELGSTCFPTFVSIGAKKPFVVWNNAGHEPILGQPDFESLPAPATVISFENGWPKQATVTLQGYIADNGSAASIGASVTNAVVLKIR